jgi:hypothetical protein
MNETYPRPLRAKERDLLDYVLPAGSPGYNEYRHHIANMVVLAEGRRGKGNFVLGKQGDRADITSPLASVIAYGVIETTFDTFTITVREFIGDQIDVEIVSSRGEEIPDHFEEKRRWTYSTWKPGLPSPASRTLVREVRINDTLTLAIALQEKRLWLYDAATMMNHLVPITMYYNELMLHKSIRDPKIALKSGLLFDELEKYSDVDLRGAFVAYNRVRKKVDVRVEETVAEEKGLKMFLRRLIGKSSF